MTLSVCVCAQDQQNSGDKLDGSRTDVEALQVTKSGLALKEGLHWHALVRDDSISEPNSAVLLEAECWRRAKGLGSGAGVMAALMAASKSRFALRPTTAAVYVSVTVEVGEVIVTVVVSTTDVKGKLVLGILVRSTQGNNSRESYITGVV